MKEVKVKIQKNGKALVYNNLAGYDGENNASKIIVEMEEFVDGVGIFEIKTNDDEFYVYATKENNTYTMDVLNVLLVQPIIEMQLRITKDEQTIYKSEIFELEVENSINAEQEVPEQYPEWIDVANAKIQEIDNAVEDLEEKVESGYFDGEDGVSPIINTSKTGKTTTITIQDAEGTKTATILDGNDGAVGPKGDKGDKGDRGPQGEQGQKGETGSQGPQGIQGEQGPAGRDGTNGQDGQDGQDGFSPIANVSKSGNTATISITDKLGTTTATVSDGVNGQDGQNGRDGTDGQDGYSPTATVTKSNNIVTISITDKNGTTTETIDESGFEVTTNKSTSISSSSTDTQYPSAKAVKDYVDANAGGNPEVIYLQDDSQNTPYNSAYNIENYGSNKANLKSFMEKFAFQGKEGNKLYLKMRKVGTSTASSGNYIAGYELHLVDYRPVVANYYTRSNSTTRVVFASDNFYDTNYTNTNGDNMFLMATCSVNATNQTYTVSSISITHLKNERLNGSDYLSKTNTGSYTPTGDYNPATKKYVDDIVGDIDTVLTNITTGGGVS